MVCLCGGNYGCKDPICKWSRYGNLTISLPETRITRQVELSYENMYKTHGRQRMMEHLSDPTVEYSSLELPNV